VARRCVSSGSGKLGLCFEKCELIELLFV